MPLSHLTDQQKAIVNHVAEEGARNALTLVSAVAGS